MPSVAKMRCAKKWPLLLAIWACQPAWAAASPVSCTALDQPASQVFSEAAPQDFEQRYDHYDKVAKQYMRSQVAAALADHKGSLSEFEKAAALNYYVYAHVQRENNSAAASAEEVLRRGKAVCGGKAMALVELLYAEGIHSRFAYTHGGTAAHSMVEVYFQNGQTGLFDPYHGLLYYDAKRQRPVGIEAISQYIACKENPPVYFADTAAKTFTSFAASYRRNVKHDDYSYPEIFTHADALGIANSGYMDTVFIVLQPEETLGNAHWQATDSEPKPWSLLSRLRKHGRYVSWAYTLGHASLGYHITHAYQLGGLTAGKRYRLSIDVANAHVMRADASKVIAVTVQQVSPMPKRAEDGAHRFALENKSYMPGKPYQPQTLAFTFTAAGPNEVFLAEAHGDLALSAIRLEKTP